MVFRPQPCFSILQRYVSYILVLYLAGTPHLAGWLVGKCQQRTGLHQQLLGWQWLLICSKCWVSEIKVEPRERFYLIAFYIKFSSSAVVCCGFQSKGDPDCFILLALQRPKENVFVPISVWCIISGLELSNSPLQGGCVGDPKSAPTWAGAVWSLRDSSGCTNQPKHLNATRGLESHNVSEDSEEHQALLQNCVFLVFHNYWLKEESLVETRQPSREQHSHSRMARSCAHLPLYWLCPHWSTSQRGTFFFCKDSSSLASAMTVCLQVISSSTALYWHLCFVSPDRAESKAPCAPLQCLQDRDAASYPSPGQDLSLDSHFGWRSLSQVEVLV